MPAAFNRCQKNGGKIRTISINDKQYARVCILDGKTHMGEIKEKATASEDPMLKQTPEAEQATAALKFTKMEITSDGTRAGTKILVNGKEVANLSSASFYWYGGLYCPVDFCYTVRDKDVKPGELGSYTTYRLSCPTPPGAMAERATASEIEKVEPTFKAVVSTHDEIEIQRPKPSNPWAQLK